MEFTKILHIMEDSGYEKEETCTENGIMNTQCACGHTGTREIRDPEKHYPACDTYYHISSPNTNIYQVWKGLCRMSLGAAGTITSQVALERIRDDADGGDCTVQIGEASRVANVGENGQIIFVNGAISWGHITLMGNITGNNTASTAASQGLIRLEGPSITVSGSETVIANTGNNAGNAKTIFNNGAGSITITGGTVSAAIGEAIHNAVDGTITVNGGTVTSGNNAIDGGTIVLVNSGEETEPRLIITGGTVRNTDSSANSRAVRNLSTGAVHILGGTVSTVSNSAFTIFSSHGTSPGALVLGGDPDLIGGGIRVAQGTLYASDGSGGTNNPQPAFAPAASRRYVLSYTSYDPLPYLVVNGGGAYAGNFELVGTLAAPAADDSGNIVARLCGDGYHVPGCDALGEKSYNYVITGDTAGGFIANQGCQAIGSQGAIQEVINAIKADAGTNDVRIQFGPGSTLDVGGAQLVFTNSGGNWGHITFAGSITGSNNEADAANQGTIRLEGPFITVNGNEIVIANTGATANNAKAIFNNGSGSISIESGTVQCDLGQAIHNAAGGNVSVTGGTVAATTGRAIHNAGGGTISVSSGTVSATSSGNVGRAVYNAADGNVIVTGGTVSASNGMAIENAGAGKVTISDNAFIDSGNSTATGGTILISGTAAAGLRLEIKGGTVRNRMGIDTTRVINNTSAHGRVEISGGSILKQSLTGDPTIGTAVCLAPTVAGSTSSINITGGTFVSYTDVQYAGGYVVRDQRTAAGTGSITIGGNISGNVILNAQSATVNSFLTIAEGWTGTINNLDLRCNTGTLSTTMHPAWWASKDILRAAAGKTISADQFSRITLRNFTNNTDGASGSQPIATYNGGYELVLEGDPTGNTAVLRAK
jgi:hypothetical protein